MDILPFDLGLGIKWPEYMKSILRLLWVFEWYDLSLMVIKNVDGQIL